jgi:predicted membrane protein
MSTLVLSIGIAVTCLTVWGVIMVGSYLLRGELAEIAPKVVGDWVPEAPVTPAFAPIEAVGLVENQGLA